MKSVSLVFVLLVSLAIVSRTVAQDCDNTGIRNCMNQFSIQEIVKMFKSPDIKTLDTKKTVHTFCSIQKQLGNCVQEYGTACKSPSTLSVETSLNAASFLCSEGKEGFIENFQCVMTKFVVNQTSIMSCLKLVQQLIEKQDTKRGSDTSSEKCRVAAKMTTCIDDKTKELCDDKAVPFVHSYLQAIIKPLMKGVKCNNGQKTMKQWWTFVMIFVTFTICLYNTLYDLW
ncbi:uncharacterized protein LOC133201717 isoform X2 [Saccostrea echinata]|uniref:uncharacterized protein LOC133201717 isoform X2 n=1 Tax=Saccostrea echinata TaxID=191078 RepID=UPI002A82B003|nr:uncharacterized protein LOC133201717 isoform X2 [Saccostrea echinata]